MAYCHRCERSFSRGSALAQHRRDSGNHNICYDCDRDFASWTGLQQHYVQSPRHFYCQSCDRHFNSENGLINHSVSMHYWCSEHRRMFSSSEGLRQHYIQSGDHYYCTLCDTLLDDVDEFLEHGEEYHYLCRPCETVFASEDDLADHDEVDHNYCRECNRLFSTPANLASHRASSIHTPRTIACPGRSCSRSFVSVSALILHAESGVCPSGITRAGVDAFVTRLDRQNVITNPARMITGPDGSYRAPAEREYWATEQSWNGCAYECFLCHAEFGSLRALDAHLRSPRHRARMYRCPMDGCNREYAVLSALSQHVERGSCGVGRNRQVQNVMNSVRGGMRTIAY